jgi:chaperonin GroES
MDIQPLYDRVLVQRLQEDESARGGIVIPDTAKDKPQQGEVVATGKGRRLDNGKFAPVEVKPGDRVIFGKYVGTEVVLNGQELLVLREEEILGVVKTG